MGSPLAASASVDVKFLLVVVRFIQSSHFAAIILLKYADFRLLIPFTLTVNNIEPSGTKAC